MEKSVSYDSENDVLYFNRGSSVQDSLDVGNFFIEFSSDGRVAGIEVLNASETVSQLTGEDFDKDVLERVEDAEIKVHRSGDFAFIVLYISIEKDGETIRENIGVNVPTAVTA